jgi:outer membrane protein assembly factor BamB
VGHDDQRPASFAARHLPEGSTAVFRVSAPFSRISLEDGAETAFQRQGLASRSAFDTAPAGRVVLAQGNTLKLLAPGDTVWETELEHPVVSGPCRTTEAAVVVTADGAALAVALANGGRLWETQVGREPPSDLWRAGTHLLAFDTSEHVLTALAPDTGAVAWRRELDDTLLDAPRVCGRNLLVATKSNRILLLDPADGTDRTSRRWPTWLINVLPVADGSLVACTDIRGSVALLDGHDLSTVRSITLGTVPMGPASPPTNLPLTWPQPTEDTAAEAFGSLRQRVPTLPVRDGAGFLYLLPLPESKP